MSYTQILYHIVINTYRSQPVLPEKYHEDLYRYIWGIIKNNHCTLYQINGVENHLHILTDLHPTVCLAKLVKDIKVSSNKWMKSSGHFPDFKKWSVGYGAFTKTYQDKQMIVNYVKKQKRHHRKETFPDEYRKLLKENGVKWDEQYLVL